MDKQRALLRRAVQGLRIELDFMTERVAAAAGLNPRDLDVLDLVVHDGDLSPTRLATRTGIHPATLTGVLARLERDGWVGRTPDPADGRSVVITAVPERVAHIEGLYAPVNARLAPLLESLTDDEVAAVISFATRAAQIARDAAGDLAP